MIDIVTDKFKGTLTGRQVSEIISAEIPGCIYIPMADGGEGTAEALEASPSGSFYTFVDHEGITSGYVPSCGEGLPWLKSQDNLPLRERTSAPVGRAVREALKSLPRVYVGIGGTRTADGGIGFAGELTGVEGEIIGLADVSCPLIADEGISALSFLQQKGATSRDVSFLKDLYRSLKARYPSEDHFGGAGGGIGFAIESILHQKVIPGAKYILQRNLGRVSGNRHPDLLITGEGCVDGQTYAGKVVAAVNSYGIRHNIPVVTFAGTTRGEVRYENVFPCQPSGSPLPSPEQAADNLRRTVRSALPLIEKLISND